MLNPAWPLSYIKTQTVGVLTDSGDLGCMIQHLLYSDSSGLRDKSTQWGRQEEACILAILAVQLTV